MTATGSDLVGNVYTGTDSLTLIIDNTAPTLLSIEDTSIPDNLLHANDTVVVTFYFQRP